MMAKIVSIDELRIRKGKPASSWLKFLDDVSELKSAHKANRRWLGIAALLLGLSLGMLLNAFMTHFGGGVGAGGYFLVAVVAFALEEYIRLVEYRKSMRRYRRALQKIAVWYGCPQKWR